MISARLALEIIYSISVLFGICCLDMKLGFRVHEVSNLDEHVVKWVMRAT